MLYNTNSLPASSEDDPLGPSTESPHPYRSIIKWQDQGSKLNIHYWKTNEPIDPDTGLPRTVFQAKSRLPYYIVEPSHGLTDPWDAPFFFEDKQNVFFVTTSEELMPVFAHPGYGIVHNQSLTQEIKIPPLILWNDTNHKPGPKFWGDGEPVGPNLGVIDTITIQRFVTEDAYVRQGIGTKGSVTYDGHQIGPSGSKQNVKKVV